MSGLNCPNLAAADENIFYYVPNFQRYEYNVCISTFMLAPKLCLNFISLWLLKLAFLSTTEKESYF